jgi:hypothetical protein
VFGAPQAVEAEADADLLAHARDPRERVAHRRLAAELADVEGARVRRAAGRQPGLQLEGQPGHLDAARRLVGQRA